MQPPLVDFSQHGVVFPSLRCLGSSEWIAMLLEYQIFLKHLPGNSSKKGKGSRMGKVFCLPSLSFQVSPAIEAKQQPLATKLQFNQACFISREVAFREMVSTELFGLKAVISPVKKYSLLAEFGRETSEVLQLLPGDFVVE